MVVGSTDDWIPARALLGPNDELERLRSPPAGIRPPIQDSHPAKFRRDGLSRECPHLASTVSLHQADLFDEVSFETGNAGSCYLATGLILPWAAAARRSFPITLV